MNDWLYRVEEEACDKGTGGWVSSWSLPALWSCDRAQVMPLLQQISYYGRRQGRQDDGLV